MTTRKPEAGVKAPADPLDPAEVSRFFARRMDHCRRLAAERQNPLYVWRAILECFAHEQPIPDWCNAYLKATAIALHRLVQQVVPSEQVEGDELPKLSPQQAAERVAQALQITRQGSNAFAAIERDEKLRRSGVNQDARLVLKGIVSVASPAAAMPDIEPRSARRRVQKGRKLIPR